MLSAWVGEEGKGPLLPAAVPHPEGADTTAFTPFGVLLVSTTAPVHTHFLDRLWNLTDHLCNFLQNRPPASSHISSACRWSPRSCRSHRPHDPSPSGEESKGPGSKSGPCTGSVRAAREGPWRGEALPGDLDTCSITTCSPHLPGQLLPLGPQ